jgi:hypothetical protein
MESLSIFQGNRSYIERVIGSLSDEQMLAMPDGFDNNIAWNLGHLILVQQSLIYRLSGLDSLTNRSHAAQFSPGTSPADWKKPLNVAELRSLLTESTQKVTADAQTNLFQSATFTPYTTTTNFHLPTFADAVNFNLYHEGLHFGAIMALRNLVK